MMACNTSSRRVLCILVTNNKSIHRNIHFSGLNIHGPSINCLWECISVDLFMVYYCKALLRQKCHALSPGYKLLVHMNQGKCIKAYVSVFYLCRVIQIQSPRSQISRIGILLIIVLNHII